MLNSVKERQKLLRQQIRQNFQEKCQGKFGGKSAKTFSGKSCPVRTRTELKNCPPAHLVGLSRIEYSLTLGYINKKAWCTCR